jgi:Tfp pilus assembly protein PilO
MNVSIDLVWNMLHTLLIVPMGWVLVYLNSQQNELWKTVSETREKYVTKAELQSDLALMHKRFDRIEEKIDRLIADHLVKR